MPVRKLSSFKTVYLSLLALSAIAGAWSGYTWELGGGHGLTSTIDGHSWFSDTFAQTSIGLRCMFGLGASF